MANFWQKGLISLGILGAFNGVSAEAETLKNSEQKENKIENVSQNSKTNNETVNTSEIRVFYKTYELRARDMIPGRLDSYTIPRNACSEKNLEKYYHQAHYNPTMNTIIINQYKMSDENAYKRGLEQIANASSFAFPKDFQASLTEFNNYLAVAKLATPIKKDGKTVKTYNGPMPKTLKDVKTILSKTDLLKPQEMEKLKKVAYDLGLNSAINVQNEIAKINKVNATKSCVGHEFGHSQFEKVIKDMEKEGKFLENLTPQDLFLLHMANEMTQYIHHDKKGMDPNEAMALFRADKENNYVALYNRYVFQQTTGSATWKQYAKQNMDIVQNNETGNSISSQSYDENSKKILDEILTHVLNEKELASVKNEFNYLRSKQEYKNIQKDYAVFVKTMTVENVEYAKDEYNVISQAYLRNLHEKKQKSAQEQYVKDGFFDNLVDVTDSYDDVIYPQRLSVQDELAHVKDLLAEKEENRNTEQLKNTASNTFVLNDETYQKLQQSTQGR